MAALFVKGLKSAIAFKPRRVSGEHKDKIIVSFYGPASAGKSSGVKILFGINPDSCHPIPGTTKDVYVWSLPKGLSVADTPGLQDTNEVLVGRAKEFIDNTDIFIYVVNSNGGITYKVKADLELLRAVGRPLLVVLNKIDTIRKSERDEFVKHQFRIADITEDSFFPVAFDPLPQISRKPINIEPVQEWINRTLREKRQSLLAKKKNAEVI